MQGGACARRHQGSTCLNATFSPCLLPHSHSRSRTLCPSISPSPPGCRWVGHKLGMHHPAEAAVLQAADDAWADEELEEAEAKAGGKGAAQPAPATVNGSGGGTPTANNGGGKSTSFQRCPTGAVIRTRTLQRKATGRHTPTPGHAPRSPRHEHPGVDVLQTVPSGRVLCALASRKDRKVICLAGPLRMTSVLRCREAPEFVERARMLWAKRGLSFIIRAIYVVLITTIGVFV